MNPQYDHNLPGIYQSTGYYASSSTESYHQISSRCRPQVHAAGFASDIHTGYSWDSVDPCFPVSTTPTGAIPIEYYSPDSLTTGESNSGANTISLQRANASRGNVGRSAMINRARAAKLRSHGKHMHGSGSGYYAQVG